MPLDPSLPFSVHGTAPTSPPDDRDHEIGRYLAHPVLRASALPALVGQANIDAYPSIRDQGQEGSCTGHGYRSVKQTQERRARAGTKKRVPEFGPRGIYELGKQVGGYPDEDGAYLRDVLKAAATYGSPYETDWRYKANAKGKPGKRFYPDALRYGVGAYARLKSLDEILTVLHTVGPVYAASDWFQSWYYPNADGTVPKPDTTDGGHCYAYIAADQDRKAFYCANSWSNVWGLNGFFWLPFDYVLSGHGGSEYWSIPDTTTQRN
jgi:hypothetical protein